MNDTPDYIRKLQRKIWLQKTPGERLLQALLDNEALFLSLKAAKESAKKTVSGKQTS
jgi:hypothetical protein